MSIVFLILPLLKKNKTEIFLYPQNCYNGVLDSLMLHTYAHRLGTTQGRVLISSYFKQAYVRQFKLEMINSYI